MKQAMQIKPEISQWQALYQCVDAVRELALWEVFFDDDIIQIDLDGVPEPVFITVMGMQGDSRGIGVYAGLDALRGLFRILTGPENTPGYVTLSYQNCIMCYFGDRDELSEEDYAPIHALGLRYRGRGQWPFFRKLETGYYPWHVNACDADLLQKALEGLIRAGKAYKDGNTSVDFEAGYLLRHYKNAADLWVSESCAMPELEAPPRERYILKDELLARRLRKQPRGKIELEVDVVYLPIPIQDEQDERPSLPRIVILADQSTGMLLGQQIIERLSEPVEDTLFSMLDRSIRSFGKPQSISLRDDRLEYDLEDFCEKTGIQLRKNALMDVIDHVVEQLIKAMET